MKKLSVIICLISTLAFAESYDFEASGEVMTKPGSFTVHDDLATAKRFAIQKANIICEGNLSQVSDWEIEDIKKNIGGVFGGSAKIKCFVKASALFNCESE